MALVTVDIDPSEVIDDLSDDELREELAKRDGKQGKSVETGLGNGDRTDAQLIEEIYRAMRHRPPSEVPDALRTLIARRTNYII